MKVGWRVFIISVVFMPAVSFAAQTIPAGFPSQSIWVSKTNVVAGEAIEIFTVVYNSGDATVGGNVVFTADGARVATKQFNLDAGKTELESVSWTATAGKHKLGASIEEAVDAASQSVLISNKNAGTIEITIANPPPPTAVEQAVNVVSTIARDVASTSVPIITSAAKSVYQATESFRNAGIAFAENNLPKQSAQKTGIAPASPNQKTVSAQSAQQNANAAPTPDTSFFSKLSQLAAPAIFYTFGSRAIFYPLLCALLLGLLYLLGRMVSKPRY